MISRRNFLLGTSAAIGAAALPAVAPVEQFGWTEFGVPIWYQGVPLFFDGGFPPPSPELLALLERRVAAAQYAFDVVMKPVFDEMFMADPNAKPCGLAALVADEEIKYRHPLGLIDPRCDECYSTAGTES